MSLLQKKPENAPAAGKVFPTAPLEMRFRLPTSKVRELLREDKMDELVQMGENAIPELIGCLSSELKEKAAEALVRIGKPAAIIRRLKFMEEWIPRDRNAAAAEAEKMMVAGVLARIGKDAVPALVEALGDSNETVRHYAVEVLGNIAKKYPEEVAYAIIHFVNGDAGDELLEINSSNDWIANKINEILLECGEAMENAA